MITAYLNVNFSHIHRNFSSQLNWLVIFSIPDKSFYRCKNSSNINENRNIPHKMATNYDKKPPIHLIPFLFLHKWKLFVLKYIRKIHRFAYILQNFHPIAAFFHFCHLLYLLRTKCEISNEMPFFNIIVNIYRNTRTLSTDFLLTSTSSAFDLAISSLN